MNLCVCVREYICVYNACDWGVCVWEGGGTSVWDV